MRSKTRVAQPPSAVLPIIPQSPILCPYCNHQYRPKKYTSAGIAEALRLHIADCPRHPIHELMDVFGSMRRLISSFLSSPLDDVFPKTSPLRKEAEALIQKADKVSSAFRPKAARKNS